MKIKLPELKFNVNKYMLTRKINRELFEEGRITEDELAKRVLQRKEVKAINKHIEEIEKIANENNIPISLSCYYFNADMVEVMMEESLEEYRNLYQKAKSESLIS